MILKICTKYLNVKQIEELIKLRIIALNNFIASFSPQDFEDPEGYKQHQKASFQVVALKDVLAELEEFEPDEEGEEVEEIFATYLNPS